MSVTRSFTQHLSFGASHVLEGHPECGRLHGHSYRVSLTWTNVPFPANFGFPMSETSRVAAVRVVNELAGKHLNDTLPTTYPSVNGMAAYLMERLRMLDVVRVEVHESDTNTTGTAEHTDR